MSFEILEDLSLADTAFRVRGKSREELFLEGGQALYAIMLQYPGELKPDIPVSFHCEAADIEFLLFDFLQEFIYFKDSKNLILVPQSVRILDKPGGVNLTCNALGEEIDRLRHSFIIDIKAITMHHFSVVAMEGAWTATVVVDV
jgi:SHS2 domain-containing protein